MEYIYTVEELARLFGSNPGYLRSLRKRYAMQQDLLIRLRLQFISKSALNNAVDRNELMLVMREAKDREALALPRRDDVRWHTFTTEEYKEAKTLVRRMEEGEEEVEEMVDELAKSVMGTEEGEVVKT